MKKLNKTLQRKLRSQRGASLSFALLLFLVCAAVGSVVLVAGTAASGRLSRMAEMDRRYYAVTSAADLLSDMLEESVTVKNTTVTTTTKNAAGQVTEGPSTEILPTTINGGPVQTTDFDSIVEDAAANLAGLVPAQAGVSPVPAITASVSRKLALTSVDGSDLAVTVEETLDPDGTLTFIIYNTNGEQYKLRLVFEGDISRRTSTQKTTSTSVDAGGGSYVTTVETVTETTVCTWKLATLETVTG